MLGEGTPVRRDKECSVPWVEFASVIFIISVEETRILPTTLICMSIFLNNIKLEEAIGEKLLRIRINKYLTWNLYNSLIKPIRE